MDISTAILSLLKDSDCVIVPGLGGFVSNRRSANINRKGDRFTPPNKDICFNSQLDHNDGAMVKFFSENHDLSFEQAQMEVEEQVANLVDELEEGEHIQIKGLGKLFLNSNDVIEFIPQVQGNILSSSYGLEEFYFPKLDKRSPVLEIDPNKKRTTFKVSVSSSRLKHALVGLPVAALLALVPLYKSPMRTSDHPVEVLRADLKASTALFEETPSRWHIDPISPIVHHEIERPALVDVPRTSPSIDDVERSSNTNDISEQKDIILAKKEPTKETIFKKYVVIAGCFEKEVNAERLLAKISEKGRSGEISTMANGLFRVAIARFEDKDKALDLMADHHMREQFPNMWLAMDKK